MLLCFCERCSGNINCKSGQVFFPRQCVLILAIMFSLADFYLIPMFALMRQGLAVSIFLYGLMLYDKGCFTKAKILFVVSVLFTCLLLLLSPALI